MFNNAFSAECGNKIWEKHNLWSFTCEYKQFIDYINLNTLKNWRKIYIFIKLQLPIALSKPLSERCQRLYECKDKSRNIKDNGVIVSVTRQHLSLSPSNEKRCLFHCATTNLRGRRPKGRVTGWNVQARRKKQTCEAREDRERGRLQGLYCFFIPPPD